MRLTGVVSWFGDCEALKSITLGGCRPLVPEVLAIMGGLSEGDRPCSIVAMARSVGPLSFGVADEWDDSELDQVLSQAIVTTSTPPDLAEFCSPCTTLTYLSSEKQ